MYTHTHMRVHTHKNLISILLLKWQKYPKFSLEIKLAVLELDNIQFYKVDWVRWWAK
jgi:hypothetical protein